MSSVATGYGFKPLNLIGGQSYNGGVIREYKVAANNSAAIFNGDLVVLSSAGQPSAVVTTSPVAIQIPATSANATAGIVGVLVGARYVNNATKQPVWQNYLPANAVTNAVSGTEVFIQVMDDPDALFQIKGSAALGTFNSGTAGSGWPGAIGKNAAIGFGSGGNTSTGVSSFNLVVGSNGGSLAATTTLALRIVDVVRGTESDDYPEFIVKFNLGVHSYYNPLGV
jgi:xanthosine utilization system XapX-like protein